MTRENGEIVRAALEAWVSGDMEELAALMQPAARIDLTANVFNPQVYEGYDGLVGQRDEVDQVWEVFDIQVEDIFERKGVVVAFTHEYGRGKASGVEVEQDTAFLVRLENGKVQEACVYRDRGQALQDAGLAGDAEDERL